jgi:hypothetical protein
MLTPAWATETHLGAKNGHAKHVRPLSLTLVAQQYHVIVQLLLDFVLGVLRRGFSLLEGADFEYEADFVVLLLFLVIACHNEIWIALLVLFRDILSCKKWLMR